MLAAVTASSSWASEAAGTSMNGAAVDGSITDMESADPHVRPSMVSWGVLIVAVAMVYFSETRVRPGELVRHRH